jgi:hypothetical protein
VSLTSGNIVWQLGGKDSDFTVQAALGQTLDSANEIFAWQHDPEPIGNNEYTFFDNESSGTALLPYSRAITVKLNPWSKVATLVASDNQPEGLSAASQGNAQTTGDGNLFVGWGILPYISEFDRQGNLIFNAGFPTGVNTYRAYLLPWNPPGSGQSGPKGPGGGQGGPKGPDDGQGGKGAGGGQGSGPGSKGSSGGHGGPKGGHSGPKRSGRSPLGR